MSIWDTIKGWFTKPLPVDWLTAGPTVETPAPLYEAVMAGKGLASSPIGPADVWRAGWYYNAKGMPAHPGRLGATIAPKAIVVHTTDMYPGAFNALVKAWQSKPGKGNAAHFLIGRTEADGIVQFAPITRNANHAGGIPYGKFREGSVDYHPNRVTVGIELDCAGRLKRDKSGNWIYPDNGKRIDSADVFVDTRGGGWHMVTEYQRRALKELVNDLQPCLKPFKPGTFVVPTGEYKANGVPWAEPFPRYPYSKNLVGHVTLDPERKSDPGPQVTAWMEKGL